MVPRKTEQWDGNVFGNVPVQGKGQVNGLPWYFRARYECWTFSIAATPDGDPVKTLFGGPGWNVEEPFGAEPFEAGWMSEETAWGFIEASLTRFLQGELKPNLPKGLQG
jgi:hypothetical protein